ncbi:Mov34/MPN/PAD-1 family protein [Dysgonomonas sp. 521]|uniref:Mov34/MPN/PAD-1 family protein n=1 Tax=Dysgonomonas sp. 521 TaxID=2302932 RepID=UPI0021030A2D|nr:Mov34/MPN/PAD-1 family protein [Dysgonomonas sp. 521]
MIDYTMEVTMEAIEALNSMCQMSGNENGGILLGSEINEKYYRINRVSEPCMLIDRSSKCGCIRNANKANEIIKREFESSNHTRFYLGEWHTHPEDNPTPSTVDISSCIIRSIPTQ